MSFSLFAQEWAQAWHHRINKSPFRTSGQTWQVGLALSLKDSGQPRAVGVLLEGGRCLSATTLNPDQLDRSPVILEADGPTWREILTEQLDPLFALLQGRLVLSKGDTNKLMPYAAAAKDLLAAASEVPTRFPSEDAKGV